MTEGKGRYAAEFRDPEMQGQIMLRLLLEERALSYRELADLIDVEMSVIAGNCGELRAKDWIGRTTEEGTSRMALTPAGTDAARKMFPSA